MNYKSVSRDINLMYRYNKFTLLPGSYSYTYTTDVFCDNSLKEHAIHTLQTATPIVINAFCVYILVHIDIFLCIEYRATRVR